MQDIDSKLKTMGIDLDRTNPPAGSYVPYINHNGLLIMSGQTCKQDGKLIFRGKVGQEFGVEQGIEAARLCGINLVKQLYKACQGDWSNLEQSLKLTVFINCTAEFEHMPKVADGASDLLLDLFGDKGRHTRVAVGAYALPGGSAVEIEGTFALTQ